MDDPGLWCLIIAIFGVALSAYFSTVTLALRLINWTKLDQAFSARQQHHRIQVIRNRRSPMLYSAAALRILSNLTLVLVVAYYYIYPENHSDSSTASHLLKTFAISALALISFSVILPYACAQRTSTALIVLSYPILYTLSLFTIPIVAFLKIFDPIFRSIAGASDEQNGERLEEKQEKLLSVVEEGQKEGIVDEKEREMIESVLDFRDTTAGEIMTPRTDIIAIEASAPFSQALQIILEEGHSRYPVFHNSIDNIIGMLYAKDLLHDLNQTDNAENIDHRIRKPFFVPKNKSLRDLLSCFQNQKVHIAVVLDEFGATAGLVSIEDILEELVGEIIDEYEPPEPEPIVKIDDRTIELDARYEVDKLNNDCDLDLPEEDDFESIGGFVISKLGHIPPTGFSFQHENLNFTILDAGPRKINRLRIVIDSTHPKIDSNNNHERP